MSPERRQIERWIGAVLVPEVRVAGTWPGMPESVPSREYLERFPPAAIVVFGRTPSGARSPTKLIEQVRATCRELGHPPPFACCDLEQGAGLHFAEGTRLPPALALASAALSEGEVVLDDERYVADRPDWWIDMAGVLTAHEARSFGIDLVLAPVCDVNTRRDNPIIAVRSFGDDPRAAGERAQLFHFGLSMGGVASCAKHFPGHGDTSQDSHVELPRVDGDAATLHATALLPFREASCVDAIMIAHLDVPALTGEPGLPCTLSSRVVTELLRFEMGFCGVVFSDAMNMGALERQPERYARALNAGCHGLLCPHDAFAAAAELLAAVDGGSLDPAVLEWAAAKMHELREERAADTKRFDPGPRGWTWLTRHYAQLLADRALRCSPTPWPWERDGQCDVLAAWPSSETPEIVVGIEGLRRACAGPRAGARRLLPVLCELRAFTGRYGLDHGEFAELERRVAAASASEPLAIAWFGSPQALPKRLWLDPRAAILLAFAPTPPMFEAVARFLAGGPLATGSLPTALG